MVEADAGELVAKTKKKLVIAATVTVDRKEFIDKLNTAFRTPTENTTSCNICGTTGLHTTDDHEFAANLTKIRESAPKSSSTLGITTPHNKATEPFTRTSSSVDLSFPANLPLQAQSKAEGEEAKGGRVGDGPGGCDGLLDRCMQVFSVADISRSTMMMLHNADVSTTTTIMDSSANICIVNNKNLFDDFRELHMPIGTAEEDAQLQISEGVTVTLHLCVNGEETVDIALTTVVYAPIARCNIISTS